MLATQRSSHSTCLLLSNVTCLHLIHRSLYTSPFKLHRPPQLLPVRFEQLLEEEHHVPAQPVFADQLSPFLPIAEQHLGDGGVGQVRRVASVRTLASPLGATSTLSRSGAVMIVRSR